MTTETTAIMQDAKAIGFWGLHIVSIRGSVAITGELAKGLDRSDLDAYAAILAEAREFAFGPVPEVTG